MAKLGSLTAFVSGSLFTMAYVALVYRTSLPVTILAGLSAGVILSLVLRNREKNIQKLGRRATVFPNRLGGGPLMLYVYRPWLQELEDIERVRKNKTLKFPSPSASKKRRNNLARTGSRRPTD